MMFRVKLPVCLVPLIIAAFFSVSCSRKTISSPTSSGPATTPASPVAYSFESTPVWQDEFEYTGAPDSAKWGYDTGGGGWGNNELQFYTTDTKNARVEGGLLTITAIKEKKETRDFTSARLVSKNKGDFLYGRVEARAKLPAGRGTWPAIWMLPTDWAYGGWPASGEIDIMEHVGYDPAKVHITVHTKAYNHSIGTQRGKNKMVPTAMTDFHRYRIDWTPENIRGFIDDEEIFFFPNEKAGADVWPFDKRFHLLLNLAIGGNWGGTQGVDETIFPATFAIDYVRVYKLKE